MKNWGIHVRWFNSVAHRQIQDSLFSSENVKTFFNQITHSLSYPLFLFHKYVLFSHHSLISDYVKLHFYLPTSQIKNCMISNKYVNLSKLFRNLSLITPISNHFLPHTLVDPIVENIFSWKCNYIIQIIIAISNKL